MNDPHLLTNALKFNRDNGLGVEWLFTAAEMLAAFRLLDADDPDGLLGRETELTTAEWSKTRSKALQVWLQDHPRWPRPVAPFAKSFNLTRWPPGYFEILRLALRNFAKPRSPSTLPGEALATALAMLDLAELDRHGPWTPNALGELLADLVGDPAPRTAYCAFEPSAVAALVLGSRGTKVVLEIPYEAMATFWSAIAVWAQCEVAVWVGSPNDPLPLPVRRNADVSVIAPPFGPDTLTWAVELAHESGGRKAICLMPNSFLFRSSVGDQAFRERAILRYGLNTVVSLPRGAVSVGSGLLASVLMLEGGIGPDRVLMVDGKDFKAGRRFDARADRDQLVSLVRRRNDGGSSRLVSLEELRANDFNLQPERYVRDPAAAELMERLARSQTVPLGDLVDLYRSQPTPVGRQTEETVQSGDRHPVKELVVSDLSDVGLASSPSKALTVSQLDLHRLRKAELFNGDILVVTKGSVGKVGFVRHLPPDETWVANQSFAILRLRQSGPIAIPTFLFRYLSSSIGQELLQSLKVGVGVQTLQMSDLKRLPVMMADFETQADVSHDVEGLFELEDQIQSIRRTQAELQTRIWPEDGE